jgi:hypothetical protein
MRPRCFTASEQQPTDVRLHAHRFLAAKVLRIGIGPGESDLRTPCARTRGSTVSEASMLMPECQASLSGTLRAVQARRVCIACSLRPASLFPFLCGRAPAWPHQKRQVVPVQLRPVLPTGRPCLPPTHAIHGVHKRPPTSEFPDSVPAASLPHGFYAHLQVPEKSMP